MAVVVRMGVRMQKLFPNLCHHKKKQWPLGLKWSRGAKRPWEVSNSGGMFRKIQNGPSMVLRFGTLNVGSLTGRSMEIAEMIECRRHCLQETRWKSNGVCHINSDKKKYKLFWNGQKTAKNGVAIFVRKPLAQEPISNGYVGEKTDGFDNVHGGFGYGKRNEDGNRILEFAESHGFCLLNTYFRKRLFKNVKVIPGEPSLNLLNTYIRKRLDPDYF
ncbi:hypothetical protein HELRODRAFT_180379 [Helobdella robusta]|uniref:Uncharacterized protein n=1 Tax=Helobdella robusta TaxID=6412 RepID=T1FFU9_HELRO|nr:hypothetical protein HELRODRAFT_180379 [Helobdella robusta]ESN93963.1 hypothetical protein HELRODRAFT_180379 [Helobdella robusta]